MSAFENYRNALWYSIISFFILCLFFYLVGYKEPIPGYQECGRYLLTFFYLGVIILAYNHRLDPRLQIGVIIIGFGLLSFGLNSLYQIYEHNLYGPSTDSYGYFKYALRFKDESYFSFLEHILKYTNFNFDDLGYSSVLYFCHNIAADKEVVVGVQLLFNTIIFALGVIYLYKLCLIIYDGNSRLSSIVVSLWGGMPFLIVTNASGLKEVTFTSLIIMGMYHIIQFKKNKAIWGILNIFLFIGLCLLFRTAIAFALFFAFGIVILFTKSNAKKMEILTVIVLLFSSILLPFIISLMGADYEHVLAVAADRTSRSGASAFQASLYPILGGFLGPFPNMNQLAAYGFMLSFGLWVKDVLSPIFLSNVINIIRTKSLLFYPLLCFCAANILMIIVSGVSLDMRYHITYIPFFLIVALAPFDLVFGKNKLGMIWAMLFLIIIVYNCR